MAHASLAVWDVKGDNPLLARANKPGSRNVQVNEDADKTPNQRGDSV